MSDTIAVVIYCPRCDYHLHLALPEDAIGTHRCIECDGLMEVYIAQGRREVVQWHSAGGEAATND